MATRNLTRKYVDIRNAQRANRLTGFHTNVIKVNGEEDGSLLETVRKIQLIVISPIEHISSFVPLPFCAIASFPSLLLSYLL